MLVVLRWLGAAAVVALGVLAAQLWSGGEVRHAAPAPAPSAQRPAQPARGADAAPGAAAQPPGGPDVASAPAQTPRAPAGDLASELGVRLVGIVLASTPEASAALIQEADGSRGGHAVGDEIAGGRARIERIGAAEVGVVDATGRHGVLTLEAGTRSPVEPPRTAQQLFEMPTGDLERLRLPEEKRLAVDLETAQRDLERQIQLSPGAGGVGVRVERAAAESPLARLGVAQGDRILSVDGVAVRDPSGGLEELARSFYSVGGSTILNVERADGSRVQIATGAGMGLPQDPAVKPAPR